MCIKEYNYCWMTPKGDKYKLNVLHLSPFEVGGVSLLTLFLFNYIINPSLGLARYETRML